ncbi:S24 family peptidase [Parvibaculum sp.]|uniref:XRE family transcriptional regulator n=1 Tax=Parvibaculum sp. TaxID=2024848 RepID=UPI0032EC8D54
MTVAARLVQIRRFLGLSQKDMGKRVGVSGTTWQNYELENASPNAHVLAHLSGEGFDMNWVLTGQGDMRGGGPKLETKEAGFSELGPRELARDEIGGAGRHVLVPRLTLRTLEGETGGRLTVEERTMLDTISFRRDFIERDLKTGTTTLVAVEMPDDAMQPTFNAGDILLADTSDPQLRGSGVYVFASGGALMVKRLQMKLDGGLTVSSDNAERYPPEEIERDALDRVKIVGRVIWRGGRL